MENMNPSPIIPAQCHSDFKFHEWSMNNIFFQLHFHICWKLDYQQLLVMELWASGSNSHSWSILFLVVIDHFQDIIVLICCLNVSDYYHVIRHFSDVFIFFIFYIYNVVYFLIVIVLIYNFLILIHWLFSWSMLNEWWCKII